MGAVPGPGTTDERPGTRDQGLRRRYNLAQMRLLVRLFASYREIAGTREVELEAPAGATVADVAAVLAQRFPRLAGPLRSASFAVDQAHVGRDAVVRENQELVVLPPVSGGAR